MGTKRERLHGVLGLFIVGILAVLPSACAKRTASNVAVGEVIGEEEGEVLQKDYIIKDKTLAKEIEVLDVKARKVGNLLQGQAIIRNRKMSTTHFEYKFEWFDEDGFPVESNVSLWKPDLLYGAETKWIGATCPKPDATGFKIMIREPNPVEEQ